MPDFFDRIVGFLSNDDYMLNLGGYEFRPLLNGYDKQNITRSYNWQEDDIFGGTSSVRFNNKKAQMIDLSGVVMPAFSGKKAFQSIDELVALADTGEAQIMVDSEGQNLGQFAILSIAEKRGNLISNGLAQKIEFSLKLKEVPE